MADDAPAGRRAGAPPRVVDGFLNYCPVPTNRKAINSLYRHVGWYWFQALRRRSQNHWLTWQRMRRHRQVVEVKPDEGRADIGIGGISRGLRRQPGTCDLSPGRERQGSGGSVFGSGAVVSVEVKEVGDRIVDGKEALDLSG